MENCLFCKIINKEIPANIVFENEEILAFKDIQPQAPVHILIIPKKHISTVSEADSEILAKMIKLVSNLAKQENITKQGFRIVINSGKNAGQTIFHLHIHLLGGRKFNWPPG